MAKTQNKILYRGSACSEGSGHSRPPVQLSYRLGVPVGWGTPTIQEKELKPPADTGQMPKTDWPGVLLSPSLTTQELIERLQGIATGPHRLRPAQSSKVGAQGCGDGRQPGRGRSHSLGLATQISSDHRAEFARCLEPLLLLGPRRAVGTGVAPNT